MESGLYVILLTDATISTVKKYGEKKYEEVKQLRERIHAAIKMDLQEKGMMDLSPILCKLQKPV